MWSRREKVGVGEGWEEEEEWLEELPGEEAGGAADQDGEVVMGSEEDQVFWIFGGRPDQDCSKVVGGGG